MNSMQYLISQRDDFYNAGNLIAASIYQTIIDNLFYNLTGLKA